MILQCIHDQNTRMLVASIDYRLKDPQPVTILDYWNKTMLREYWRHWQAVIDPKRPA